MEPKPELKPVLKPKPLMEPKPELKPVLKPKPLMDPKPEHGAKNQAIFGEAPAFSTFRMEH